MEYANLPFPSVTICNTNPVRQSSLIDLPGEIQDFVEEQQPNNDFQVAPENAGMGPNRRKVRIYNIILDWKID